MSELEVLREPSNGGPGVSLLRASRFWIGVDLDGGEAT